MAYKLFAVVAVLFAFSNAPAFADDTATAIQKSLLDHGVSAAEVESLRAACQGAKLEDLSSTECGAQVIRIFGNVQTSTLDNAGAVRFLKAAGVVSDSDTNPADDKLVFTWLYTLKGGVPGPSYLAAYEYHKFTKRPVVVSANKELVQKALRETIPYYVLQVPSIQTWLNL